MNWLDQQLVDKQANEDRRAPQQHLDDEASEMGQTGFPELHLIDGTQHADRLADQGGHHDHDHGSQHGLAEAADLEVGKVAGEEVGAARCLSGLPFGVKSWVKLCCVSGVRQFAPIYFGYLVKSGPFWMGWSGSIRACAPQEPTFLGFGF